MNEGADKFSGFSPESLDFLRDLKVNNSKGWFEAHRSDYEQRLLIERKPYEFERMIAFLVDQDRFAVEGEQYKRLINSAVPEHLRPWHQRKSVYLVCNRQSDGQLYNRKLLNELITGFTLLEPLYHSFSKLRIAGMH